MSEIAVAVHNLSKIYRLYTKPLYRFLDIFGWLKTPNAYSEHAALAGINLDIRKGEKVAIIGRNGAGKSTLLKLICGAIEPTSGQIHINGKIHALLQIGTGFHPDFTGRENVYSYLANLGLSGRKADEKVREIIEFSELEEYIDQPMKTYSTGMGVRIMFATSTAITPDILVLDEVLGVGDGYFVQKSYERIASLCEKEKTTLVLVTHDLYSAAKICERCIWIDQGKVLLDTDTVSAIERYESSIKLQEERRLRKLHLKNIKRNDISCDVVFSQISCYGSVPIDCDLPISLIELMEGSEVLSGIDMAHDKSAGGDVELFLADGENNWGERRIIDGKTTRSFTPEGSIYYRAPLILKSERFLKAMESDNLSVRIEYLDTTKIPCKFVLFCSDGISKFVGPFNNCGVGEWITSEITLKKNFEMDTYKKGTTRFGNQRFSIVDVDFFDEMDKRSYIFKFGGVMKIKCKYIIRNPSFREKPIIQFAFLKEGTLHTHRFVLDTIEFAYDDNPEGRLEVEVNPITFAPGEYLLNAAVMSEGGYDSEKKAKFFSINQNMLDHHPRAYKIKIDKTNDILIDTSVFSHFAKWKKNGQDVYSGIYGIK